MYTLYMYLFKRIIMIDTNKIISKDKDYIIKYIHNILDVHKTIDKDLDLIYFKEDLHRDNCILITNLLISYIYTIEVNDYNMYIDDVLEAMYCADMVMNVDRSRNWLYMIYSVELINKILSHSITI